MAPETHPVLRFVPRVFTLALASALFAACGGGSSGGTTDPVVPPTVSTVSVTLSSSSLTVGQTTQGSATLRDANGNVLTGRTVTWSTGSAAVATVSASGLVTAVAAGSTTVVATSEGRSGQATLQVTAPVTVATVTVALVSSSLTVGQTTQAATPKDASGNVLTGRIITWSTGSAATATVNGNGLVTALAAGSTTVIATCEGQTGQASLQVSAPQGVTIAGGVFAPNGTIAAAPAGAPPASLRSRSGSGATGVFTGVGAGVTVKLIEIDSSRTQVGTALATTTTLADGSYSLVAPAGFVPAAKYVIRAYGATGTIDAMVTGTTINVDPVTNTTTQLITAAAPNLSGVTTGEVQTVQGEVQVIANDPSLTYTNSGSATQTLGGIATASADLTNVVSSMVAPGLIRGRVTDTLGNPVPGIRILVRDFGNWVTRAMADTDASGTYTVNVPFGDFILGARNATRTSDAASEWWTSSGGAVNQFDAERVAVPDANAVVRDFVLEAGVAIQGNVRAAGGALDASPLGAVSMNLRDFDNDQPTFGVPTGKDGSFIIHVRPNRNFYLAALNTTGAPYAAQYLGLDNTMVAHGTEAALIATTLGIPVTANFTLPAGTKVSGIVRNRPAASGGQPVTGTSVTFLETDGTTLNSIRTELDGGYRFWLPASASAHSYLVRTRGQDWTVDVTAVPATLDFENDMKTITGVLHDANGGPASQVKVTVYGVSGTSPNFQFQNGGTEVASADGSFTVFSRYETFIIEGKIDGSKPIGSILAGGHGFYFQRNSAAADPIVMPSHTLDVGTQSMPVGGVLTGKVNPGSGAKGNYVVWVNVGPSGSGFGGGSHFIATRTQSDGSYLIVLPYSASLPSGSSYFVCPFPPGQNSCPGNAKPVVINSASTTLDF